MESEDDRFPNVIAFVEIVIKGYWKMSEELAINKENKAIKNRQLINLRTNEKGNNHKIPQCSAVNNI